MSKQLNVTDAPAYFTKTFTSSFLLQEITTGETRENGKPYYRVRLQDATGSIFGTIWQEYMSDSHTQMQGQVVDIKSIVSKNEDGNYHLVIRDMKPCQEYIMSDYINGLMEEESIRYLDLLCRFVDSIKNEPLKGLVKNIFQHIDDFDKYPASINGHHAFSGGLLVYTVSVTCLAKYMQKSLSSYNINPDPSPPYDTDLLTAAALLHAVGTVHMVTPSPNMKRIPGSIPLSLHEHTIRHIQRDVGRMEGEVPEEDVLSLLFHVIGCVYEDEARKPVVREALILKSAVVLHNKITLLEHFMEKNKDRTGIVFDDILGNYIYLQEEESQ